MQPIPLISYEEFISILLTALAVILAALGLGIGALAILGYTQLKRGLHEMAKKHVEEAMEKKLKEYPTPIDMQNYQNQIVAPPAPNQVAVASNVGVQKEGADEPAPQRTVSAPYPGEEPNDGHDEPH